MEQCLSRNPDINVVYTINEPAGEGAYAALTAAKSQNKAFIVSIDGSCQGMSDLKNGIFAADATQYPGKMADLSVSGDQRDRRRSQAPPLPPARTSSTPAPSSSPQSRWQVSRAKRSPTARRPVGARHPTDNRAQTRGMTP